MYCLVYEVLGNREIIVGLPEGGIGPLELEQCMDFDVHTRLLGCNIFFPRLVKLTGEIQWDSTKKKFIGGTINM